MAESIPENFDPYYRWLAIPPSEQPPHHYRLLGLPLFESNADVIDSAADRQAAHVRSHTAGPHGAASQKLLNEIAKARVCLLNPTSKAQYDAQLQETLAPLSREPLFGSLRGEATRSALISPPPKRPVRSPPSSTNGVRLASMFGAASLCGLLAVFLLGGALHPALDVFGLFHKRQTASLPTPVPGSANDSDPNPQAPEPQREQPAPQPVTEVSEPVATPTAEENAAPAKIAKEEPHGLSEPPSPTPEESSRGIPNAAAIGRAADAMQTFLDEETPEHLLQRATAADLAPAERFVVLSRARDKAAAAMSIGVALQAAGELAKHFDVDPLTAKLETVLALDAASQTAEADVSPAAWRALAETALPLIKQLSTQGDREKAMQCVNAALRAARKAEDQPLVNRVTLAALEAQEPPP